MVYVVTNLGIDIYHFDKIFNLVWNRSYTSVDLRNYHNVYTMDIRKIMVI